MRRLVASVLLSVFVGIPMSPKNLAAGTVRKASLQLTTSVVKVRSCFPGHLGLNLKFTFRNIGREPVIVDKGSFPVRTLVARSLKAVAAKKYEQEINAHLYADIFPMNPTDMSNFAILQPGEAYDLQNEQTRVSLYIDDGARSSKGDLRPGSYFLQIEVATWTYLEDAEQFRRKWQANGLLWAGGVTSEPMPFTVEQNRPIEKCR